MSELNNLWLGVSQLVMKLNLGPFQVLGLGVCLLGLGFQFSGSEALAGETSEEGDLEKRARVRVSKSGDGVIASSRRRREKTKRRVYFPFRDLKSMDVIVEQPLVVSDMDEFILESEERRGVLAERDRLKDVERNWRSLGLGPKHPDVLTAPETIDELERRIWEAWKADPRSRGERK